jgi:glycosyltransferase EpsF
VKIIHIVENLDKGAVENWLVNVFLKSREIRPDWQWTFYCILGQEGRLDEVVRKAGGIILYSPVTISQKLPFLRYLRSTLQIGQYDIIHAHHDYLSGFYLLASIGIKAKKRILHIHNTDKELPVGNRVLKCLLLAPLKRLAFGLSDTIVGISKDTLAEFKGKTKNKRIQFKVLYYGIDLSAFTLETNQLWLKTALNIPQSDKLLLFIGRLNPLKNPVFVVDILSEILTERKDVYALFVGQGDLKDAIIQKALQLNVLDHIRLLGWRNDIPQILHSVDLFVFPRLAYPKEGLGLVVVEAQAAGLGMLLSHGIVEDAVVIRPLVHFLPNVTDTNLWAKKIMDLLDAAPPCTKEEAYRKMQSSPFELSTGTNNLLALYIGEGE